VSILSLTTARRVLRARSARRAAALVFLGLLAAAPAAPAAVGGGAAGARPPVTELRCPAGTTDEVVACPRGEVLRLSGQYLDRARTVVFLGGPGARDDRRATPTTASPRRVLVRVPKGAKTGPVRVISAGTGSSEPGPRLRVLPARRVGPASFGSGPAVFPVRGKYDFGTFVNSFGGGRGHQGQDVLARCGVPVVSALSGEIQHVASHSRAGNYVVVQADDGSSQAYMHLREPVTLKKGEAVKAGDQLGVVGRTGRASACHLHFELWTAPGWYLGGTPVDPLPTLKEWAQATADG
jgi:murein DD-endopeptidase MepM/ murein hydrolase activator NlpD